MYQSYLRDFFTAYEYPAEGSEFLLSHLDQLLAHPVVGQKLLDAVQAYEAGKANETPQILELLTQVQQCAKECGFPMEPVSLLLFLMMTRHLKQRCRDAGLPQGCFDGVARDLRSKLNECHTVRGIWGSFVPTWFPRFFVPDRFTFGRLQYEIIRIPAEYCTPETAQYAGQPAVNIHIPSGCPLDIEAVRASMKEAANFFAARFPEGKVPFVCHSWLLFPGHREMLPETSSIRRFMDEFTLLTDYIDETRHDLWRIFATDEIQDLSALPRDTSLQRAYLKWLEAGKPIGGGLGIRWIQGG